MLNWFKKKKQAILISNSGEEYIINPRKYTKIGRSRSEDIIIVIDDDMKVSRQNSAVSYDEDVYYIEDLGSKHGTYVNGNKIEEKTTLKSGDIITIGSYTKFTFELR